MKRRKMELGPPYSGHLSFIAEPKPKEQPLPRNDGMWVAGWRSRKWGRKTKCQEAHEVKSRVFLPVDLCSHPSVSTGMKGL